MDVIVNRKKVLIELNGESAAINGTDYPFDVFKIDDNTYHLLLDNTSYRIELNKTNGGNLSLKCNNILATAHIKDNLETVLEKMGLKLGGNTKIKELKAPMPGLVLNILVQEGEAVAKDQPLLVLEAMKMENVIKSPSDVVIGAINIKNGTKVDKGQVLIQFS